MTDRLVDDLSAFISSSPSSFHAVEEAARRLEAEGFRRLDEDRDLIEDIVPGAGDFVIRDGSIIAWRIGAQAQPTSGFRVVGAHTDSPGFRLKTHEAIDRFGFRQVGVEVYGGPLLNSWLDRELALAGRLGLADGSTVTTRVDRIARIPQLAVHLDREANSGLTLDRQRHTMPIIGLDTGGADVLALLAEAAGVDPSEVLAHEIITCPSEAPGTFGADHEFFAAPRMDNLVSVHAGLQALLAHEPEGDDGIAMLAAFDHEEVGSASRSGAAGPFLDDMTARISAALGADDAARRRALSSSWCLSADAAHAVHPNYSERHDPLVHPLAGRGPVLKINANQRYATDARGGAIWHRLLDRAGIPGQEFVGNNAVPCGSTIGPISATRLGMVTIDVGIPLLSMHSAREMVAVADLHDFAGATEAFLGAR